jgi:peptidoglycan/xylan/chitin deacetylase (PgdA/CDA1 family)
LPASFDRIDRPNVAYFGCRGLHESETLARIRRLDPWLGVAIGAPILRPSVFDIPREGTVNLHKSLLPAYRGMPPGFWELHDGSAQTGASVHRVAGQLDAGEILYQAPLQIAPYATPAGLAAQLDRLGTEVLIEALRRIDRAAPRPVPQPASTTPPGRRPSWRVARAVRRRTVRRREARAAPGGVLRHGARQAMLAAYVYLWCPIRNTLRRVRGRCHATVLLYHRVSDDYLDSITVGVEQFARHLDHLARHYDVVDLPTLLDRRGRPRNRPCVVITFDDGYADNLVAAMLLRRRGLPATFFISTGIVGRGEAFGHDLTALGRRVAPLTWDQVRQMSRWGFAFGNHTATHARLSRLPLPEAIEEICTADRDLDRELGRNGAPRYLAYPFGGRGDIPDPVRRTLPEYGIEACLSAYGGVNGPDFDPLDVRRQGVDCGFSELAFRAAVEGWRFQA